MIIYIQFNINITMFNYPKIDQPVNVSVKLLDNQLTSIYYMKEEEGKKHIDVNGMIIESNVRILGDRPAAGKTLSVCGYLSLKNNKEWDEKKELYKIKRTVHGTESGLISCYTYDHYNKICCDLIICSPNLIEQWERELEYTDLVYYTIDSKKDFKVNPNRYDVILISSIRCDEFVKHYEINKFAWRRMIFDEFSDNIIKLDFFKAGFYWFISGTWQKFLNRQNTRFTRNNMITNLLYNLEPNLYRNLVVSCPDDYILACYKPADPIYITHKCVRLYIVAALENTVEKNVINMINAGNVSAALESMGCKSCDDIFVILRRAAQNKIDEAQFKVGIYRDTNKKLYDEWVLKLARLKEKLKTFEDRISDLLNKECTICFDNLNDPVILPCCLYIMCGRCLTNLYTLSKFTCPLCRAKIDPKNVLKLKDKEGKEGKYNDDDDVKILSKKNKNKQDTLLDIIQKGLEQDKNKKFLLFSEYDETYSSLKYLFKSININFSELKGRRITRQKIIDEYKNGTCNVLFLNSKFNGSGLNLQCTTDIILYSDMSELLKIQNIGRVARYGKIQPFNVHQFEYE